MTQDDRRFRGVWIPAEIWLDRSLSIVEKVMLVEIDSLQSKDRGCFASNTRFAEFFGLSVSRVSEIISGLAKKGLITVEHIRQGKQIVERRIWISHPFGKPNTPSEKADNPFGKRGEPPSEKAKESNTLTNNTLSNTDIDRAFDVFWNSGMVKTGKKPALQKFTLLVKSRSLDPMEFASQLADDVRARLAANQFGFEKLHPTTYLNQERWNDDIPPASTKRNGRPSINDFSDGDDPFAGMRTTL